MNRLSKSLPSTRFLSFLQQRNSNFNKHDTKFKNSLVQSKKFNTLASFIQQNASHVYMRQFHTNHVLREPTIATSEFKMLFTRDLLLLGLIAASFLVVFWFWDSERDGVYFQVVDSEQLDVNTWEETLVNGQSKSTVKMNGKIMLKERSEQSFIQKPLETKPKSIDEILLIHYLLTCYRSEGSVGRGRLRFATHNFYLERNNPLIMKFQDPTNPSNEIIVDFHINKAIIGTIQGKIQQDETLVHLNNERVILGSGIDGFLDEMDSTVKKLNSGDKQNWTWKKEFTFDNQKLQENVLRNGKLSFVGGQFRKGKNGNLEFHCSWISHKPEQEFIKVLPVKWYEKIKRHK